MAQYLPQGSRGEPSQGDFTPRVVEYLTTVSGRQSLGLRNLRELRTLGQALDALLVGNTLFAMDTLMQRFKSVEMASQEGSWAVAQHLELTPMTDVSSVAEGERHAATKEELLQRKLARQGRGSERVRRAAGEEKPVG